MAMYEQVYRTWLAFRQGKKPSQAIDKFEYDLTTNLLRLAADIQQGSYRHGGYRRVVVTEKKRRDLAVAEVRDRVVHRLVYDELVRVFDKKFDPDVWSCRKGKGLHACLARTQKLLRKYPTSYVWRVDVTKFFDSVDHEALKACLSRNNRLSKVEPWKVLGLCCEIIDSYSCGDDRGIPIGNLTSQIFANIYLNEFDRYVRHVLKPLAYVRYGDDCILFCRTRAVARQMRQKSVKFLTDELKLTINPKNDVIVPASSGLHFLGHAITDKYAVVDRHTTKSALQKTNIRNIASYKSLKLVKWPKRQLDWQLLDEITEIIDPKH
jgi:retron-type reverse transcriptase